MEKYWFCCIVNCVLNAISVLHSIAILTFTNWAIHEGNQVHASGFLIWHQLFYAFLVLHSSSHRIVGNLHILPSLMGVKYFLKSRYNLFQFIDNDFNWLCVCRIYVLEWNIWISSNNHKPWNNCAINILHKRQHIRYVYGYSLLLCFNKE